MRAAVIQRFGDAAELTAGDVPDPTEKPGWTLVRLNAAALNWHDVLVRRALYRSPLPHVMGSDGAGIATDSGDEVIVLPSLGWGDREAAPAPGWEILGDHRSGTYAEYVSVPTECVFTKPRGLDWHQAAALPLVGVTAYRALVSRGGLRAGESVLISGAGGGVAPMAVAIAAAIGAHAAVTSSSADKIDRAVLGGAVGGVLYTDPEWPDTAKRMTTEGRGFDLVLDTVGTWSDSLRALRPGGRLVVLGASRDESPVVSARPFFFGQQSILGTTMGSPADFRGLLELLDAGSLAPPQIDSTFPLERGADAHAYLETGRAFGKIILDIAPTEGTA